MSIRTWFSNVFSGLKGKLQAFFEGPGGVIMRNALSVVVQQAGEVGMAMLLDAARGKVTQLNNAPLTNDLKREQSLDYLRGYALQQGLNVSESLLRYTLETAVNAVKGEQG